MTVNKRLSIIFAVLTVLMTVFVFSNSLKIGTESAKQSGFFTDILNNALDSIGMHPEYETLSFFIRKGAHFTEYFILGGLAATSIYFATANAPLVFIAPLYTFIIAVCDEFIFQRMTDGRGPQWKDVFIDLSGALTAVLILFLIIHFKKKK